MPISKSLRYVDVIRSFIAPAPVVSKKLVKTAICSTSAISQEGFFQLGSVVHSSS